MSRNYPTAPSNSGSRTVTQTIQPDTLEANKDAVSQILETIERRRRQKVSDTLDSKVKGQGTLSAGSSTQSTRQEATLEEDYGTRITGNLRVENEATNVEHATRSGKNSTALTAGGNATLDDLNVKAAPAADDEGNSGKPSGKHTAFKVEKNLAAKHGDIKVESGSGTCTTGLHVGGDALFKNGLNVTLKARK